MIVNSTQLTSEDSCQQSHHQGEGQDTQWRWGRVSVHQQFRGDLVHHFDPPAKVTMGGTL